MKEYHKINSVYKRDEKTHKFLDELSNPEVACIYAWIGEEKIDGTNIRVNYNPETKKVIFGGRTDNAQLPTGLLTYLQETFTPEKFEKMGVTKETTLYGEGVGEKIQGDSIKYLPKGQKFGFILFDVTINDFQLDIAQVTEFAVSIGVTRAPVMIVGSLAEMEKMVKTGFLSKLGADNKKMSEGLVIKTPVPIYNRYGKRIITKLKYADFHK